MGERSASIPPILREILRCRGVVGEKNIEEFLSYRPQLAYDPFLFADMRAGVDLLCDAIDSGAQIVIYGDYDCDGVTSTVLLMRALGCLTDKLDYYIPSRLEEGYGLHREAIDRIHAAGGELILTVDCGSVSADEVAYAHSLGIETLITDHHTVRDVRAPGILINPKAPGNAYPFSGLAGVGVAYKLALALSREREIPRRLLTELLELVAVGTIADVMPLVDENRSLVKYGLRLLHLGGCNKGLRRLIEMAGASLETLTASAIAFAVAPRINAAGRLGDATRGVRLLLAEDEAEIEHCCTALMEANAERRALQDAAYERCLPLAEAAAAEGDFLLLEADGAHEGILGIVAGKLKEHFYRPVVIVSGEDETCKGTGRSIEGVDLFRMLSRHRESFLRFGGHRAACGFTMLRSGVAELRTALNRDMAALTAEHPELLEPQIQPEATLSPEEANLELAKALELLEPCGAGNEQPVLRFPSVHIEDWQYLKGDTRYARFRIRSRGDGLSCVLFHDAAALHAYALSHTAVDVCGRLGINRWQGRERAQLTVLTLQPSE